MCKHILNAQVTIRYYDGNWYDCPLCFSDENGLYPDMQRIGTEMVFACKLCKKCFRKDMTQFEEPDEYCPHCGNCYVVEAVTPETVQEEKLQKRLKRAAAVREAEENNKQLNAENDEETKTKLPSIET
jgi:hypothetical protein|tara:strand:- start:128 stop:511 length:384 start_codon:yes stop_codon:yes gene_type:complete